MTDQGGNGYLIAAQAMSLGLRRDTSLPDEPSDGFARGQLTGVIVCTATVALLFVLRFFVKFTSGTKMLLDDWTCIVAWVSIMLYSMTTFLMMHYGLGRHVTEVSPDHFVEIMKWLYASSIVYIPATYITKVTLLLLIARVFAVMDRVVRGIHIFIAALFFAYLPIQIVKIAICNPIPSYWDPNVAGSCLDQRKIFVSDLCLAIITDTTILPLPIPLTWSLSFSWQKKLRVGLLLGAGGAATAITSYRLYLAIMFIGSTDTTYDFAWLAQLTLLEMSLGLACTCLPSVNVLIERFRGRRKAFPSSRRQRREHQLRPRTRRSQLPPDRRHGCGGAGNSGSEKHSSASTLRASTISGKGMTSSTSHDRTSRTTTTLSRVLGSSPASVEIKGGTESQERNTGGFNQKEQAGTHTHHHGRDEMRPASKRTPNAMATTASTTAKSRDNNNSNQDLESSSSSPLPESPDFDIEAQMKSGGPVLLTRNREQALSAGGAGFLRLVDAAQGRREGWLAPAGQVLADFNDVGGHDGREPTAAGAGARGGGTATTRNSAMVLDPQQSSTLQDVAGHAGASSKGDWIWDGMWHNPNG